MSASDRLWLNGFSTVSEMLANDRLAIAQVRQALEEESPDQGPFAAWWAGLEAGVRACFGE